MTQSETSHWREKLKKIINENFLVVGVGNEIRGDDAIGCFIAEEGRKKFPENFINAGVALENHLFKILEKPQKLVFIVDAVSGREISVCGLNELRTQGISTHSLNLGEMKFFFDEAGKKCVFVGIPAEKNSINEGISDRIKRAGREIADFFCEKIREVKNA
ncbi:MAG: hydrogenase maturation protease [Elusimicrobia bacterium]|nr:hydrogenase maturation protease [Elusimicrobiota bacterium]